MSERTEALAVVVDLEMNRGRAPTVGRIRNRERVELRDAVTQLAIVGSVERPVLAGLKSSVVT